MPAFGFLLIIAGIFLLINVFNGNLTNLVLGNVQLNFSGNKTTPVSSTIPMTPPTTAAGQGQSGFNNPAASAGQGGGGGGGGVF